MKTFFALFFCTLATSAFAIDFFSEEDVVRELGAQKAIEVSKYQVGPLLGLRCEGIVRSRSARTYVVKVAANNVALFATPESLGDLTRCNDL